MRLRQGHSYLSFGEPGFLRQASEQYLTSFQLAAHFFRHVIVRPHATQGLLGKNCLFPLKGRGGVLIPKYAGRDWISRLPCRNHHCLEALQPSSAHGGNQLNTQKVHTAVASIRAAVPPLMASNLQSPNRSGRPQANFACLRPPLMSNVSRQSMSTQAKLQAINSVVLVVASFASDEFEQYVKDSDAKMTLDGFSVWMAAPFALMLIAVVLSHSVRTQVVLALSGMWVVAGVLL